MKKILKIFLLTVGGLLLLLVVAAGFLLATCDNDDYGRGLVFLVDQLTDYRLELGDSCSVNLSAAPAFSTATLKIFRPGHSESLSFRNVEITLFPAALLHGHVKVKVAGLVNEKKTLSWLLPRELYALNSVEFSGLVAIGPSMLKLQKIKARGRTSRGAVLELSGRGKINDFSAAQPFSSLDFLVKVASPVSTDFAGYLPDGLPELGPVHGTLRLAARSPRDLAVKDLQLDFAAGGAMHLRVEGKIAKIPVDPRVVNSGIDLDITLKAPQTASIATLVGLPLPELGPVQISASLRGSKKASQVRNFNMSAGIDDNLRLKAAGEFEFGDFTVGGPVPLRKINLEGVFNAPAGSELLSASAEKGWKVPSSGPLAATFQLHGDGKVIRLTEFSGRIGQSNLSAALELLLAGKRPRLSGLVTVQTVYLDDIFPRLAIPLPEESEERNGDPLPVEGKTDKKSSSRSTVFFDQKPLPLLWLLRCGCDVDVDLSVARLLDAGQTEILHNLDVAVKLENNVFSLDPVSFGYEGGYVKARLLIDDDEVPSLSFAADADDLDLVQALRCVGLSSPLTGKVTLDADLHSRGKTVHELAANLGGRFEAALEEGRIPTHTLALVAVDLLGWSFNRTVMKRRYVDISCGVIGIQADQGVLTCKALLDTPNVLVTGAGSIDLGSETCDLVLNPKKKRKFWAVVTPVTMKGPLRDPDVRAIPVASAAILSGGVLLAPQFFLPAIGLNYLWEMLSKDKSGVKSPCFERLRRQ
ncbi:MAG: hypothetical protein DRH04_04510 [Deltaproteobacteria bacterium]|nr:MAG: hypothetical protein DRH04_04510 [Deltaproteobacteria bacterium]